MSELIQLDPSEQLLFYNYCKQEARTAEKLAEQMKKLDVPRDVLMLTQTKASAFNAVAHLLLRDEDLQVVTPADVGTTETLEEPEDFDVHPDAD